MTSLPDIITRIILIICIPFRIVQELYFCYVSRPHPASEEDKCYSDDSDTSIDQDQKKLWDGEGKSMDSWWGENALMVQLRKMNPIRIRLVAEAYLKEVMGLENTWEDTVRQDGQCLKGVKVCDVGCGGGLLSEALAETGASVTGIDMVAGAIRIAERHWLETHGQASNNRPEYLCTSLESLVNERAETYDVVICSEVLEHVIDPETFAENCCKLVRPGGCVVFTTVNRTMWSLIVTLVIGEDLLGLSPHNLHRLFMCVKPEEIYRWLRRLNWKITKTIGITRIIRWQPRDVTWKTSDCTKECYAVIAKRPDN